jgi:hypothetical protein
MTVALVLVSTALTLAIPALIALGWRHLNLVKAHAPIEHARDVARAELAQRTEELAIATARIGTLDTALALVRKEITYARIQTIANAEPGDVGAALDRVLADRQREQAARADHRPAPPVAVPAAGPATDGPRPTWAGVEG